MRTALIPSLNAGPLGRAIETCGFIGFKKLVVIKKIKETLHSCGLLVLLNELSINVS